MTLYRQLLIAVVVLLITLYGVSIVVGIYNNRELVQQQMEVHAQDTATSVALSMTQAAQEKDMASLGAMFNAVSDSGYFRQITYKDLSGKILLDRQFDVDVQGVPEWFVRNISLPSPEGRAEVASGWMRLGELVVISHPGQAYNKLWQVTKDQLLWFALVTLIVCVTAIFALRIILNPLVRVEQQANAICNQDFMVQPSVPRTRELRRVVEAMNRMARRLQSIFDHQLSLIGQLQEQSLRDSVTGLFNRMGFDTQLRSFVRPDTSAVSGALVILSIDHFERVNEQAGRLEGNAVLKRLGEKLQLVLKPYTRSVLARRQGPEITVFVPYLIESDARELAQALYDAAVSVEWKGQDTDPLVFRMGFTYTERLEDASEMLHEANAARQQAIDNGVEGWVASDQLEGGLVPLLTSDASEWQHVLQDAIENEHTTILFQPVYSAKRKLIGHEIYSRLVSGDQLISAGIFMPLAERFGIAHHFDRLALERLSEFALRLPKNLVLCVNFSASSIQNDEFITWLCQYLGKHRDIARRLVVEIPEHAMHVEERYVRQLCEKLSRYDVRLGIDHFGLESSAFSYLASLPIHHIKIHRSFVRQIDENPDNRFYIQSLAQVARSRDISLAVEGVEREEEWQALVDLEIDAMQGYFLGQPASEPVKE